ncbi:MAG: sel1 repeat family protein [Rhodobacteraceae bacterium]|nr:sel1 repeat family protein [Paracoccaceae bacterium]
MGTAPLEQSNEAALDWFRLAAKQGFAPAQSMLGVMYFAGAGTPQDYETAHMWSNIAAGNTWKSDFVAADVLANLQQNSRESRDSVERLMTPEAIERAQARARRCVASKYAECD